MNALERFREALSGRTSTKIPCWPQAYLYPVHFCRGGMQVYCMDARAFADAQLRALEIFGYDAVGAGPDITMEAESLGAAIEIPRDAEPYITRHPVKRESDVNVLRVPDFRTTGRLQMVIQATEMLAQRVKGSTPIFCQLRSPFVLASNLLGIQQMMTAVIAAPDLVRRLLAFTTRFCEGYGLALIAAGADVVEVGNAVAGMLSPELYREFAAGPLKAVVDRYQAEDAVVAVHMCGNTEHLMDQMIGSGADILEIDSSLSIPDLVQRYGRPVTWLGNIHPVDVLLKGPPGAVRNAALGLLRRMGRTGRFILSAGCEPSIRTPAEHLHAMVDAVKAFNGSDDEASSLSNEEAEVT
jgi:uroporphyrinogen decarboxylase